jgi:pyridoxine 4-dehydrogenase
MKQSIKEKPTFLLGGHLSINRMGFGAMRLTGPQIWGEPPSLSEARAVLKRALELGVNFIDTADSYGPEISENIIAETLYPYPKGVVIATKGGLVRPGPGSWQPLGRPEYLIQCVEMSLRRLRLERIDLYQLHAVDPKVPLEESLGALKIMQAQGKIRYIGLSNVSVAEIERARKIIDVVSVQNQYNIQKLDSETVLEYCNKHQIAFIPWYPIGSGQLAKSGGAIQKIAKEKGVSTAQIALAWLLHHSKVMVPIPGTSSLEHLEENVAASFIELSQEDMKKLT